ncbi:MAG: undecaprenyldiphospho-muramoylpentapeptide beta-N-acetylglucosaminyltransferase [Rickettsiaceae bacterium]|nr:MAG: undecaprenyldiphospho-muramoylpentapeptide beta-N-acetylglucosaminyltransferase [Rickettsiaceae bacterium]
MKSIILNAGGTGGHFFPAIAIGEELALRGIDVHLVTDLRCMKYLLLDSTQFTVHVVDIRIKNSQLLAKIKFFADLIVATAKAIFILYKIKPRLILSFGGYPTIPSLLAGLVLRIPILIHEQNSHMGKVNKIFAKVAKVVAISYPKTKIKEKISNKVIITGDLIRKNILALAKKHNFTDQTLSIFIVAGSQGAKFFNQLVPSAILLVSTLAPNLKLNIVQQAAKEDQASISEIYSKNSNINFELNEFFFDIPNKYALAHLAICRAGATTIAELTAIGLPAILVPFPYASDNHQYFNAKTIEDIGGGWCFEQSELTIEILSNKIFALINDRDILKQASIKLQQRKTDGVDILASTVEKIIYQSGI